MDVRGVAQQEGSADPIARDNALVDREIRQPDRIRKAHSVEACTIEMLLDFLKSRVAMIRWSFGRRFPRRSVDS